MSVISTPDRHRRPSHRGGLLACWARGPPSPHLGRRRCRRSSSPARADGGSGPHPHHSLEGVRAGSARAGVCRRVSLLGPFDRRARLCSVRVSETGLVEIIPTCHGGTRGADKGFTSARSWPCPWATRRLRPSWEQLSARGWRSRFGFRDHHDAVIVVGGDQSDGQHRHRRTETIVGDTGSARTNARLLGTPWASSIGRSARVEWTHGNVPRGTAPREGVGVGHLHVHRHQTPGSEVESGSPCASRCARVFSVYVFTLSASPTGLGSW